jgi:hypothetical protein
MSLGVGIAIGPCGGPVERFVQIRARECDAGAIARKQDDVEVHHEAGWRLVRQIAELLD